MSEYQYYEFVALDGPISDEGMAYARGCSTRAEVSRVHWRNVYNFGDFSGSVERLLQHYDAHFYIANWGTVRFALSFPEGVLDPEAVEPYVRGHEQYESTLTMGSNGARTIVWWEYQEEGGWGWTEGEGTISLLSGIREELMRGDYRALFLGWLADFHPDEWRDPRDSAVLVPPIPSGLDCLTPSLQTLIERFPVDQDALTVAAGQATGGMPKRTPIPKTVDKLSTADMKALLVRVAEGDGSRVMSELNRLSSGSATSACFIAAFMRASVVSGRQSASAQPPYAGYFRTQLHGMRDGGMVAAERSSHSCMEFALSRDLRAKLSIAGVCLFVVGTLVLPAVHSWELAHAGETARRTVCGCRSEQQPVSQGATRRSVGFRVLRPVWPRHHIRCASCRRAGRLLLPDHSRYRFRAPRHIVDRPFDRRVARGSGGLRGGADFLAGV